MKKRNVNSDWRHTDEELEKRRYLLTFFIKNGFTISSGLYEFCDYYISQGITGDEEGIIKEFERYKELSL